MHRLDARARIAHLRRARRARHDRRRDPDLDPRLPSVAVRRQPHRHRRVRPASPASSSPAPPPRHTFRFLYAPGTIGAITWLARNRDTAARIVHGLTLTCLGDDHPFTYKRTVGGDAHDRSRRRPRARARPAATTRSIDFFPYGYDERQYNSPGLPAARRLADARPARRVPRVPHLGRQPRVRVGRADGRVVPAARRRSSASLDRNRTYAQPRARTASRSSAHAGSTARSAARRSPTPSWRCCGCSTSPTASTACSTSPSAAGIDVRLDRRRRRDVLEDARPARADGDDPPSGHRTGTTAVSGKRRSNTMP